MVVSSTSGLSTRRFNLVGWTTLRIFHPFRFSTQRIVHRFCGHREVGVNCLTMETLCGIVTGGLGKAKWILKKGIKPEGRTNMCLPRCCYLCLVSLRPAPRPFWLSPTRMVQLTHMDGERGKALAFWSGGRAFESVPWWLFWSNRVEPSGGQSASGENNYTPYSLLVLVNCQFKKKPHIFK